MNSEKKESVKAVKYDSVYNVTDKIEVAMFF